VKGRATSLMVAIAAAAILWFVLSRLRIVVFVNLPWWGLALLILVPLVVLYLAADHFINGNR
jgi:hypothetical protein